MSLQYVPFSETGSPLDYVERVISQHDLVGIGPFMTEQYGRKIYWKPNVEFEARLTFNGFERGRSAAHAIFTDDGSNTQYQMFLKDFADMFEYGVAGKYIYGKFTFVKRGKNYGIRYLQYLTPKHAILD